MVFDPFASIEKNIAAINAVADELPLVIIVQHIPTFKVIYMSQTGLQLLNATSEELYKMSNEEYVKTYFNPEDADDYVPKIKEMIAQNTDEPVTFFQQVRIHGEPDWVWHMVSIKIMMRNHEGLPHYIMINAVPIDSVKHVKAKVSRLLAENTFLRKNYFNFSKLSKRECDILRLQCLGKSSAQCAEQLFISVSTVETHRRNIRAKLETNSLYKLSEYARAFDLI
jgi:DNA-binding CsgD family transcriptional regulator